MRGLHLEAQYREGVRELGHGTVSTRPRLVKLEPNKVLFRTNGTCAETTAALTLNYGTRAMQLRFVPATGVVLAVILFLIAAARFPGGYHWTSDYICTLLRSAPDQPLPLLVRVPAIAAVLCYSAAFGVLFYRLSVVAPTCAHKKILQIAGIASVVYSSFTMTPMHDLMVTISFVSFLIASAAVMHILFLRRARSLLLFGGLGLTAQGVAAVLYYGGHYGMALSVAQKIGLALCTGWLLWTHESLIPVEGQGLTGDASLKMAKS